MSRFRSSNADYTTSSGSTTDQAGGTAKKVWTGNETAYAAIETKDANTIYYVYADE